MASSVIHMCIAKKINQKLKLPENILLLGSIAPDISKHIGETKEKSHFLNEDHTVNIDWFLIKYKKYINHPFIMGYFIHLYTDLLWDRYFMSEIVEKNAITLLDGSTIEKNPETYKNLIYHDYTNLNIQLLDCYQLDLSLFYEEVILPEIEMDEIPIKKLPLLINHTGIIIQNTKEQKAYTFNLENIKSFIETSSELILSVIEQLT